MNFPLLTPAVTSAAPLEIAGKTSAQAPAGSFAGFLGAAIGNVESTQAAANSAASDLLVQGKGDVHSVALATQRADLSLELFQQVRNKFVQAYQEIMRMPM